MKVLVTGNQGYIGSVLVDMLLEKKYEVVGYDIGYYADCLLQPYHPKIEQIVKDIRDINEGDMKKSCLLDRTFKNHNKKGLLLF